MAVPKQKTSKRRSKMQRNARYSRDKKLSVKCKQCGADKLPHRACQECGSEK